MNLLVIIIFVLTLMLVLSKRTVALINGFMLQSFCLFVLALTRAVWAKDSELYVVAALILLLKVGLIPYFLRWMVKKIKIDDNLGLSINPMLSLVIAVLLSFFSYLFAERIMGLQNKPDVAAFSVSLSVILIGIFIMVFRMKAVAQVIGLLVIENGSFLTAVALCGSIPFFVEIAIFFDIFVFAIILGIFIFRINKLFTHIDIDKLKTLRG
ncbi:MAG: hypothetical protein A2297_03085 [Elusimicrobia bacterium RIFOXYB2_FULL_48_7]|nr:MAG: hypothetical protein A2252_06070 [Elusimicrobia bacterium RIFOXYA2_FULL_39_19]OGS23647.1 MAG: hypothetical protein A2297_03085 [Elusimicrobia bacterium RIFOXYB2_FULL_48_7]